MLKMADQFKKFNKVLKESKNILILTGAGVSAESGIPVFRGTGGFWRTYKSQDVATPGAFRSNPSLVWEFYHYRRHIAFNAAPNAAHRVLAKYEQICKQEGREFNIITQNVDGLHTRAGSENVTELHGGLDKVICTKCKFVEVNLDNPICEALKDRGDPNLKEDLPPIPVECLPRCTQCNALTRPYIVWFGENLDKGVLNKAKTLVDSCDLCLVIGTSSAVYPAAMFAPYVAERGIPVAEFNLMDEPASNLFKFHFAGPCGTTIPKAFEIEAE